MADDTSPITFLVPGQSLPGGVSGSAERGTAAARRGPGRVKAAVRVGAQRSAGAPQRLVAQPGEDVVALHIAGGPVLYLHPANARDLMLAMGTTPVTRGAEQAEVLVSAELRWRGLEQGPVTRGLLGDVVLGAFELLTGFAKDKAADFAAGEVVRRVDAQVEAGVYALVPEALPRLKGSGRRIADGATIPASADPALVFIHGTFVESTSTFGKLWALHPSRVRELFRHYGGRVYALEHETLGKSPIANALTLVKALPEGQRLHLVTHSRGGLVAEVLARLAHQRGVSGADLSFFARTEHAAQRAELEALAAEVARRRILVERVVRVACPARGTLLAAKRLDAYLSVLKWTIESTGVPVVPELLEFVAEVARRRADPSMIPGLAAMIPDTPLVNWLNAAPEPIGGELRVVAGDLEGDSIGSWLKTLLADAYYWTDNDIVVHTRSMYGGAPRAGGARFLLDQGGKTTHFAYFANPRTVDAVVGGLIEADAPPGFMPIGPLSWKGEDAGGLRGAEARPDPARPAVFVLPGILGSNLKAGEHRIWLSLRLIGGLDKLAYSPTDEVEPDGPIGLVYDRLIEHLANRKYDVRPFAFDWRKPIEEEALRLADAIEEALDARTASGQPVRLLAHSMGGLVARTVQLVRPDVWDRLMAHAGARLVMLGTPNGGSYAPMQVLSGDDTFGNALAAFGSPLADRKARQIMAAMPGFIQLQADLLDAQLGLSSAATWSRLAEDDYKRSQQNNWWHRSAGEAMEAAYRWGVPPQAVLDQALALRRRLDAQRERDLARFADRLALVVGRARSTPVGYEVSPEQGFVYLDAGDGDGRVPLQSALLPGVKTWQLACEHGSLPSEKQAFDAFAELLDEGRTAKLEALSPTRGQAAGDKAALRKSRPSRRRQNAQPPGSEASVFSQAGAESAAATPPAAGSALDVEVLNGNLSFVAEPLFVGHYRSSELTGTEAAVDRMLGGAMKTALEVGLYPEARGKQSVFVNTARDPLNPWRPPRPRAAVVVGLGDEGTLREADLVHGVTQAVLAWAQRLAEERGEGNASTAIAATLIGSGGLGVSTSSAARAIARGVREANLLLAGTGWPRIDRLTLVELYLDRAGDAWQGLQVLAAASPEAYRLAPQIRSGTGPLRRQLDSGYRGADYDLITAVAPQPGAIEFALDSRRARTELRSQNTQLGLVRDLVRKAATATHDEPTIGRTLFQLLVPAEIEPFLGGTDRMVLDLDVGTAAIPWELLDAGPSASGSDRRPWAIRSQLLRRLRKAEFRQAPRDTGAEDHALIVGEPLLDADAPYGPLPAARDEALAVHEALTGRGGIPAERVLPLVDAPDATAVINALLSRPWRIVHIAGHGEAQADGGRGVVLSGGHFLGANEVRAMRSVPEMVFLNCCHLGAWRHQAVLAKADPAALAATIADELIGLGVRCVVVTGWAVEDTPAAIFARRLYQELLAGARFVDAVSAAREACWAAAPGGKTWAAYQCYGDPNWRLRTEVADANAAHATNAVHRRDEFAAIATPVALALALENLATETRFMGRPPAAQRERIVQLQERFAGAWGGIGAVAEAFGVAWEAAGGRNEAIGWFEHAVAANDGSASLKAAETLHNLVARRAWTDVSGAGAPDAAVERALAGLRALNHERPTVERLSLLGSAYKRRALIERRNGNAGAERSALRESLEAYRQAEALAAQKDPGARFYPGLNRMALELLLRPSGSTRPPWDEQATAAVRASLEGKARADPDFWSQVGLVEFELVQALAAGQLAAAAPALERAWSELHERVASQGWWASVADQASLVLAPSAAAGEMPARRAAIRLWRLVLGFAGMDQHALLGPLPPVPEPTGVVLWHAPRDAGLAADLTHAVRAADSAAWTPRADSGPQQLEAALRGAWLCVLLVGPGLARHKQAWRDYVAIRNALGRPGPKPGFLGLLAPGCTPPDSLADLAFEPLPPAAALAGLVATRAAAERKRIEVEAAGAAGSGSAA
jgi:hypothetical protein